MKNIHIYLFRVKFIKNVQLPLEFNEIQPSQIFINAISEKPDFSTKEECSWHIGNVEFINETFGTFAVGRTTMSNLPRFDDTKKDFLEEPSENSPYTIVYFDSRIGLIGIKHNYQLSAKANGIAAKIEQLLASTKVVNETISNVEISNVKDPVSFVNKLKNAHSIKKFTVTFSGPNPFDADEHFHKPMSVYLQEAEGKEGKTIIDGNSLKASVLIDITHSVAATGNNAIARLKKTSDEKVISVSLKDNPAKIVVSDNATSTEIYNAIIKAYNEVRNK